MTSHNQKEENAKVIREFQKRKSIRKVLFIFSIAFLVFIGVIILPLFDNLEIERMAWTPFVYLILIGVIIAIGFVWRCPACNASLGDVFKTKYCSRCGFDFHQRSENTVGD